MNILVTSFSQRDIFESVSLAKLTFKREKKDINNFPLPVRSRLSLQRNEHGQTNVHMQSSLIINNK